MLPKSAGNNQLSEAPYKKLQVFYQQFCGGSNRNYYGLGHLIYACHAAFPLLLSPHLANIIWLNFKNYTSNGVTRKIAPEAVSDFLSSTICRQVAHQQYEVDPEIRGYLLFHLKNSKWFGLYGIQNFGEERLNNVADCIFRYFNEPLLQQYTAQKGFREVNEWAVLAYRNPQALAYKVAQRLKEQIDSANSPGQLRINMLMEKLNHQYDMNIHVGGEKNTGSFINLYRYSKARKAVLFNEEPDTVFQMMDEIDDGLTNSSIANAIELPVEKNIQERVKRKSQDVQQVHALLVALDKYEGEEDFPGDIGVNIPNRMREHGANNIKEQLLNMQENLKFKIHISYLLNEEATREKLLLALQELYERASPEDIVLIYFSCQAINSNPKENFLVLYDSGHNKSDTTSFLSNHFFKSELSKWNRSKNCQTVFLLDTETGYYDWVSENDIFIGAVSNNGQAAYFEDRDRSSYFSEALNSVLSTGVHRLTYQSLAEWIRFKMKLEEGGLEERPAIIISKENLRKNFLRNRDSQLPFHYLSAFNPVVSVWEIIPKDFIALKQNDAVDFRIYLEDDAGFRKNRGVVLTNPTQKIYYYFGQGLPNMHAGLAQEIEPVRPSLQYQLNYSTSPTLNNNQLAEEIRLILNNILFDEYSPWAGMKEYTPSRKSNNEEVDNETIIQIGISGVKILFINAESYFIQLPVEEKILRVESKSSDKIVLALEKFCRYHYLSTLALNKDGIIEEMDIEININWSLKSGTGRRINNTSNLEIDGRFIEVVDGEIQFPAVKVELINRERFSVFVEVYLLLSDGTISRIASIKNLRGLSKNNPVPEEYSIMIEANDSIIKMYAEGLLAKCKFLVSREPFNNDFSQPAIV